MNHQFATPEPVDLYLEIHRGSITIDAGDHETTEISIDGARADEVTVTQDGTSIRVVAPRSRVSFSSRDDVDLRLRCPAHSSVQTKVGSADLTATGILGTTRITSGAGDLRLSAVDGECVIDSGSGDISVGTCTGEVRIKSGSGDVELDAAEGAVAISTGSGDVTVERTPQPTVLKSGTGDLRVERAQSELQLNSASGDLTVGVIERGAVQAKNATGDIRIGVRAGVPVWTDVSSITGRLTSDLSGAGQPQPGQPHLEIRATTVSGDVALTQR